ncbi:DUF1707 domain-containing protein [Actinokineospora guangxiensis]|uniref:DUF1707 domain-containing protein n=1 Tax=Actinokineospora guangxiensis TaxID=1490288 RepID=A0ABW0ESX6_9PSEU
MSEPAWEHVRIGDTERETALRALGEHMGAGRLTVDEYGERSARVATAKTRGDLADLFADLPEPRPRFGPITPPPAYPPPAYPAPAYPPPHYGHHHPVPVHPSRPPARRWDPATIAVAVLAFGVLLVGFRWGVPFVLLPILLVVLISRRRRF